MKNLIKASVIAMVPLSVSTAQAQDWEFTASFYLYMAETETGVGGNNITLSFSDALDNLDFAGMGSFEASRGPWTLLADYMLTDLSFGTDTPGPVFSGVNTNAKTQIATFVALLDVHEAQGSTFAIGGGVRWFDTDTTITFLPGPGAGRTVGSRDNWTDAIIAARYQFDIAQNWSGTVFVDYGGFSGDTETWQLLATADWKFADNWVARFGYRQIGVENDEGGRGYEFEQSGPVIGIAYNF
ncbi:hypothetical protein [Roseobacter sp.]|uniref:hypothetical protein n=1 Tax=Roseobacter sp. TaxID=1907202 RepID=UPI0025E2FA97|nr:hypothetical protein [Roseobacter sp.]